MSINLTAHAHPVDGAWIVSYAAMGDDRQVHFHTDLTATYKLEAFTATVFLQYLDANGRVLGLSPQWTHNCGPAPLFGADHVSSGEFTETAPVGTVAIDIVQIGTLIDWFSVVFGSVAQAMQILLSQIPPIVGQGPTGQVPTGGTTPQDDPFPTPPDWETVVKAAHGNALVTHS